MPHTRSKQRKPLRPHERSFDWVDELLPRVDVAVLSWGAHWHAAPKVSMELATLAERLRGAAARRRRGGADQTVLWRTTSSGHPNCSSFAAVGARAAAPIGQAEYDALWARAVAARDKSVVDFNWHEFTK